MLSGAHTSRHANIQIPKNPNVDTLLEGCSVTPESSLPSSPPFSPLPLLLPFSEFRKFTLVPWSLWSPSLSPSARSLFPLWPRPSARCWEAFKTWRSLLLGMRSLGSGSSNSAEIKGLQGRDGLRGPVSLFLNENPEREGEKFCPDPLRLGFIVILNFHFLGLGLDWEGVADGETDRRVSPYNLLMSPSKPTPQSFPVQNGLLSRDKLS